MALEIIDNLQDKLNGKLSVTREDLLVLVNSWGRRIGFATKDSQNKDIYIGSCESTQSEQALLVRKECYNLSKLDTSKITNMSDVFTYNLFDGDISQWNTSNVTKMDYMFYEAKKFNQDLSSWDISNVITMDYMFYNTIKFNQNISSWKLDNIKSSYSMFDNTKAFLDKYNNGYCLLDDTEDIKEWFVLNRDRMNMIALKEKYGKEVDDFFFNITNLTQQIKKDV